MCVSVVLHEERMNYLFFSTISVGILGAWNIEAQPPTITRPL